MCVCMCVYVCVCARVCVCKCVSVCGGWVGGQFKLYYSILQLPRQEGWMQALASSEEGKTCSR